MASLQRPGYRKRRREVHSTASHASDTCCWPCPLEDDEGNPAHVFVLLESSRKASDIDIAAVHGCRSADCSSNISGCRLEPQERPSSLPFFPHSGILESSVHSSSFHFSRTFKLSTACVQNKQQQRWQYNALRTFCGPSHFPSQYPP